MPFDFAAAQRQIASITSYAGGNALQYKGQTEKVMMGELRVKPILTEGGIQDVAVTTVTSSRSSVLWTDGEPKKGQRVMLYTLVNGVIDPASGKALKIVQVTSDAINYTLDLEHIHQ